MEFGKVEVRQLERIDFRLPADPLVNREVLSTGKGQTKFYIGCAKWGRKDWIGKLYPPGTKEKDFLECYAKLFNSIELNATYYKSPDRAQVTAWRKKAGKDFRFCPKFPEAITHTGMLQHTGPALQAFLEAIAAFEASLGPVFLMPNPQMGPDALPVIERFMTGLPQELPLFLEARHPGFYTGGYHPALYRFLREQQRGAVITDAAGRRDCVHMHLSTP